MWVAGTIAAVAGVWVYFTFDPAGSELFPRCMFLTLTGLKCPGCGTQRALHALLHGDVASAWGCNALLLIELPLIALLLAAPKLSGRLPGLQRVLNSEPLITAILVTTIGWTVIRNIFDI